MSKVNQNPENLPTGIGHDGYNIGHLGFFGRIGRKIVRAISHLPLGVLYVFSDVTCFILHHILHYRQKVVLDNLATIFPEKDEAERRKVLNHFYRHLSDYFFETIKALTISDEELRQRIVIRNPEVVDNLIKEGKSVFVYAAHMGNWEWFTCFPLYHPTTRVQCFYQGQPDAFADYMTLEVRTRRGIWSVESHRGFRYMVSTEKSGIRTMTLVIGDQCPHYGAPKFWLDFFGKDTPFLVGPEHISRKLGIALVFPSFVEYKRGHYEVEYKVISTDPAAEPLKQPTATFAKLLEQDVRNLPHLWLLSHKRWKLKHEDFPDEK